MPVCTQNLCDPCPYERTDRRLVDLPRRQAQPSIRRGRRGGQAQHTHTQAHTLVHAQARASPAPAPRPALALTVAHALQEVLEGFGQLAGLWEESRLS